MIVNNQTDNQTNWHPAYLHKKVPSAFLPAAHHDVLVLNWSVHNMVMVPMRGKSGEDETTQGSSHFCPQNLGKAVTTASHDARRKPNKTVEW